MERRIRLATVADAPAVRSIYRPHVESSSISFEVEPPTQSEMATRIDETLDRYPWLVCETGDGDVVGYATADSLRSAGAYDWTVESSVYVADDHRQSGVGTALYESLLAVLERQGFRSAYAAVTVPNRPSERLHERLGFERVGTFPHAGYKDGEWRDVQWWYRGLGERRSDPDRPTPLTEFEDPDLARAVRAGERRF